MLYKIKLDTKFKGYPSITAEIEDIIKKSGINEGYFIIFSKDSTIGFGITSFWDKRGLDDLVDEIDRSFPARVSYKNQQSPNIASGTVKSAFIGANDLIFIKNGKPLLGSSQGVVLLEFDGPRARECYIKLVEKDIYMQKCDILTTKMGMHDLTEDIKQVIEKSNVKNGFCHISMPHSTAGILLCKNEKNALEDIMCDIERIVPTRVDFKHRETAADAGGHVKTVFSGSQISLPIQAGELMLEKDQSVVFSEFDGPRPRSFFVGVVAD